jgi:D-aminopeptidase
VPSPQKALATVEELSGHGHSDVFVKDMHGNSIELDVLRATVDTEASRTIGLVLR